MSYEELQQLVFESLGAASVCWLPAPTGVFDSTRALEIGENMIAKLLETPGFVREEGPNVV